jgi:DNA-nicking Smr family endonuclease
LDKKSGLDDQDEELFRREISDVRPLTHKQAEKKSSPSPVLSRPAAGGRESSTETSDSLSFIRPGVQSSALQKLKRGRFRIEATLDLHGLRAVEAKAELHLFIQSARARALQAVRIVHGKGHGSEGGQPVLRPKIRQWLRELPAVLAFTSASPRNGGSGAVDVLLRK